MALSVNLLVNEERVNNDLDRLLFSQTMEDIAFEAAELIDIEAENPFATASLLIASHDLS